MGKTGLVEKMAGAAGITEATAAKAFDGLVEGIIEGAKAGERVTIVGLDTFSVAKRKRKARKGKNPRTGEEINIPAKNVLKFNLSRIRHSRSKPGASG